MDAVAGELFVKYSPKEFGRINLNTGEQSAMFMSWRKEQGVPWPDPEDEFVLIKKVQPLKKPDSEDICSAGTNECRDFCVPTMVDDTESKSCFCEEGYELQADFECRKKYVAYAVVAAGHELLAVDLQTDQVTTILSDLTNVTNVDFFCEGGEEYLLFWVDDGSVFQGQWSSGGPVSHVQLRMKPRNGSRVTEVAVDRASRRHLYWLMKDDITYKEGSVAILQMVPFEGLHVKTLYVNSWENQHDLTIDRSSINFLLHKEGFSWLDTRFWSGHGPVSLCDRADSGLNPTSLLLDLPLVGEWQTTGSFWVDRASQSVSAIFDTVPRYQLVIHPSLSNPRGLDGMRSRLLWLDSLGQLWTAHIPGGRGFECGSQIVPRMVAGLSGGLAVRLLHPERQPAEYPACRDGGGCSHFCVGLQQSEATCACPDGLKLARDQKLCEGPNRLFPGPPIWTLKPTPVISTAGSRYNCPGRKYSEPGDLWAAGQ